MNVCADLARHAVALAAFCALTAVSTAAQAVVTYTYTGPALNEFSNDNPAHPISAAGLVASFVLDAPLEANAGSTDNFAPVTPLSWSVTGGGYSLSSSNVGAGLSGGGMSVFTDASGALQGWDFLAYSTDGIQQVGPSFRSFFYPTGQFQTSGAAIKTDAVAYWGLSAGVSAGLNASLVGGSWTVSAVPEPGTTAMWLAGMGALGLLLRRRMRA